MSLSEILAGLKVDSKTLRERKIALNDELKKIPHRCPYKVDETNEILTNLLENAVVYIEEVKEIEERLKIIKKQMRVIVITRTLTLGYEPLAVWILRKTGYYVEQPPASTRERKRDEE
jgi:signal transduction histidine kinase